jgi:signal transduction histidine kinase
MFCYLANNSSHIQTPPVFQDVFRDLVMNARKYSFPGGDVEASMINDGKFLTIEVSDNGFVYAVLNV